MVKQPINGSLFPTNAISDFEMDMCPLPIQTTNQTQDIFNQVTFCIKIYQHLFLCTSKK